MKNSLVSVIVPNYNYARYLDERMESILAQTYQNFEIIILDDCSTDNSQEVIERYRSNPHVSQIVYNEANSGSPFLQWDKGISLAKGELCWICEADDSCRPELLQRLVEQHERHDNLSFAMCRTLWIDESGKITFGIRPTDKPEVFKGTDFIRKKMCSSNIVLNSAMVLFRTSAAQGITKQYKQYRGCGDYMFWIELAEMGDVAVVNEPLNMFRRHSNTVTSQCMAEGTSYQYMWKLLQYIMSKGLFTERERNLYMAGKLDSIRNGVFISENVRQRLLQLWDMPEKTFALCKRRMIIDFKIERWKEHIIHPIYTLRLKWYKSVKKMPYDEVVHLMLGF